jgi:CTP:molybdopterin cytidylyltransferase MocA
MGASLRRGLQAAYDTDARAAVVTLVDLPDVGADVVTRVLAAVGDDPRSLGRAAYRGTPGHPVVLGREHWSGVTADAAGDRGARDYLAAHEVLLVECGDLAGGLDVDAPPDGVQDGWKG